MLRHAVTLTFDPLTLNFCGRSGITWSIYVPNLSEIDHSAAELLTINDRFFVSFRGAPILRELFLKRVDRSAPDLVGTLADNRYTQCLKMVKISCLVSKPQQLKIERWSAIMPKIALFDPL